MQFNTAELYPWADFVGMIEELAGRKANLMAKPKQAADVLTTYADTSKAIELLRYDPKVTVREGVSAFWDWYTENG